MALPEPAAPVSTSARPAHATHGADAGGAGADATGDRSATGSGRGVTPDVALGRVSAGRRARSARGQLVLGARCRGRDVRKPSGTGRPVAGSSASGSS